MNIYEKIYREESKRRTKAYGELCDIADKQLHEFARLQHLDSSLFPAIIADLLHDKKLTQAEDIIKQINYHLHWGLK